MVVDILNPVGVERRFVDVGIRKHCWKTRWSALLDDRKTREDGNEVIVKEH